jgi:hypothetical protein
MPLFDFINDSDKEFVFGDGSYSLRKFDPTGDIPKDDLPGLSRRDLDYVKQADWALVYENADQNIEEDINRMLLSFKR